MCKGWARGLGEMKQSGRCKSKKLSSIYIRNGRIWASEWTARGGGPGLETCARRWEGLQVSWNTIAMKTCDGVTKYIHMRAEEASAQGRIGGEVTRRRDTRDGAAVWIGVRYLRPRKRCNWGLNARKIGD